MSLPGDFQSQCDVLMRLAEEHCRAGKHDQAIDKLLELRTLSTAANDPDPALVVSILQHLGVAHRNAEHHGPAIKYTQQAVDAARLLGDSKLVRATLYDRALAVYNRGKEKISSPDFRETCDAREDIEDSIVCWDEVLKLAEAAGDTATEGRAVGNLGNAHFNLGRIDEAITFHRRRLELAEASGDPAAVARACGNLGNALSASNQFDEAIQAYEHSVKVAQQSGNRLGYAQGLFAMGFACSKQKRFDDAIHYFEGHLSVAIELNNQTEQRRAWYNLRSVYQHLHDQPNAEKYDKLINETRPEQGMKRQAEQEQPEQQQEQPQPVPGNENTGTPETRVRASSFNRFKRLFSFRSSAVQLFSDSDAANDRGDVQVSTVKRSPGRSRLAPPRSPETATESASDKPSDGQRKSDREPVPVSLLDMVERFSATRFEDQRAAPPVIADPNWTPGPDEMASPLDPLFDRLGQSSRLDDQRAEANPL